MNTSASDNVALLILAAGSSSRMLGRDKLLENINGQSLLAHIIDIAAATGHLVFVTLPVGDVAKNNVIDAKPVQTIDVPDATSGMSASLRAWANSGYADGRDVMVLLADMPEITTADLQTLLKVFAWHGKNKVIRATSSTGIAGHPVLFPARLARHFADLIGDHGAKSVLTGEDIVSVPLPDSHAITDLDTPAQWDAWRSERSKNR